MNIRACFVIALAVFAAILIWPLVQALQNVANKLQF